MPHLSMPSVGVQRCSVAGSANDSSWRNACVCASSASKPASETGPGSSISRMSVPSSAYERTTASADFVPCTRRRSPATSTPPASMTTSLSATSVCHASLVGASTDAVKTRPRGASRLVTPIRRSSTTRTTVCASTPSISVVRAPVSRSMRWTSARLHPTLQCTASQRPSRDSVIDCIDSSIGRSPKTSSSWPWWSPTTCHQTRSPYSCPAG